MYDADFIAFLEEEESGATQKALIKPQAMHRDRKIHWKQASMD
jgi:hypothetical protein